MSSRISAALAIALLSAVWVSAAGKVYWSDSDGIKRVDPDGTDEELIWPVGARPQCLAVDETAGRLYWPDGLCGAASTILEANLDGGGVTTFLGSGQVSNACCVRLYDGKLYWTEANSIDPRIRRANLDGSGVENVLTDADGLDHPEALDVFQGHLYWVEPSLRLIRKATVDGAAVVDLVTTGGVPEALDVDFGGIVWSEGEIWTAGLDGGGPQPLSGSPSWVHGVRATTSMLYGTAAWVGLFAMPRSGGTVVTLVADGDTHFANGIELLGHVAPTLFEDGFESGDLDAWSGSTPDRP